jgi:hypothetical protein
MNEVATTTDTASRVPRRPEKQGPPVPTVHRPIKATYRGATADDKDAILKLLKEMHEEVSIYVMSEPKVIDKIDNVISSGVCFLAVVDDEVVGSLGCEPCQPWYSEDVYLGERWTFVKEDFRRSTIARDLLKLADDFSTKMDMVLVIGVFSPKHTAGKNALFRRVFKPMGEFFVGGKHDVL